MSKKILTVGYQIPGQSDNYLAFDSKMSLIDADLVIFSPNIEAYYSRDNNFQGKTTYSQSGSFQLKEDLSHWRQELRDFVKSGRNAVVLLSPKEDFFLHTGEKSYSGTGRGRITTNIVKPHSNYESLPVSLEGLTLAHGKELVPAPNLKDVYKFNELLRASIEYRVYFRMSEGLEVLYTTKDSSRIVAATASIGNGKIIMLPYISYDQSKFTEYKTVKGEEKSYWNTKGLAFGQQMIEMLLRIDSELSSESESTPPPDWSRQEEFILPSELKIQESITKNVQQIEKLRTEKSQLELKLAEVSELRALLYETGKPLEHASIKALRLLGFEAENYDDGVLELDQVIVSPEKMRYIGECEGKDNKAINIDKLRQLIESMNADFARDEIDEKAYGILFGNACRLKEPTQRKEWFTAKCMTGAAREGIALIKTPELFKVAQYLMEKEDKAFAKRCRNAIKNNLGKVVVFPPVPVKINDEGDIKLSRV